VIDSVAYELGLDPVDVRRRNMIQPDEMPFATHFEGIVYDESNYPAALDMLLEKIDYRELREEQARRRADGSTALLGIGFSTFAEMGGFGPTPLL
jgi:carbon-monoxide dehydrogenase large subunit